MRTCSASRQCCSGSPAPATSISIGRSVFYTDYLKGPLRFRIARLHCAGRSIAWCGPERSRERIHTKVPAGRRVTPVDRGRPGRRMDDRDGGSCDTAPQTCVHRTHRTMLVPETRPAGRSDRPTGGRNPPAQGRRLGAQLPSGLDRLAAALATAATRRTTGSRYGAFECSALDAPISLRKDRWAACLAAPGRHWLHPFLGL